MCIMKRKLSSILNLSTGFLGLVCAFSVTYTCLAFCVPMGTARMPGAGFMPRIVGVMASVLSLILLVQEIAKASKGENDKQEKLAHPLRLLWFTISFVIYVLLFRPLGYVVDTALFTFALCMIMENNWKISIVISIVTGVAFYLVFSLLSVPLPLGILSNLNIL